MSYFVEGSYHKRKNGKLHIYIRNEKYKNKLKSNNYYGRTYIDGRQKMFSSETNNKAEAIKILEKWYDKLQFKKEMGIGIHDSSVKDCLKEYLKSFKEDQSRSKNTLSFFKQKLDAISKCKELMKLSINSITIDDVNKHFLLWRMQNAKKENKVLRGATLKGDLTALSSFFNWCFKKGLRQKKIENLSTQLLTKKLRHQRTQRMAFSKEEYKFLVKTSQLRFRQGRSKRIRFERERLHHFIIFMVGTGLRVDEALGLEWNDIRAVDRNKINDPNNSFGNDFLSELERYYLEINVSQSKTNERKAYGTGSAYFAYNNLITLYKSTGIKKVGEGKIFGVKSFRDGLNPLLHKCNLKFAKIGDVFVKRDAKSFRNTFIQFMLDKGMSSTVVAKMCGTSTQMIDKFYTANMALESMLDTFNKVSRPQLKVVNLK
jgi:integrase